MIIYSVNDPITCDRQWFTNIQDARREASELNAWNQENHYKPPLTEVERHEFQPTRAGVVALLQTYG